MKNAQMSRIFDGLLGTTQYSDHFNTRKLRPTFSGCKNFFFSFHLKLAGFSDLVTHHTHMLTTV